VYLQLKSGLFSAQMHLFLCGRIGFLKQSQAYASVQQGFFAPAIINQQQ
jgi:hypothetical protein